jgi:hypothetical protein
MLLAEIFMLRVETATREAAKEAATSSRFVPITLPAADTPLALVSAPRAREASPCISAIRS